MAIPGLHDPSRRAKFESERHTEDTVIHTIASMLERRAAERPQRILWPFSECHVTFAAQDDMNAL